MALKYSQSYSYSDTPEIRDLGDGLPHFADGEMRPYEHVNCYIADHFHRWSANTTRAVAENLYPFLRWPEESNLDIVAVKLRHVELYMNALIAYRKSLVRRACACPSEPQPLSVSTVVRRVNHVCFFYQWLKRQSGAEILWDGDHNAAETLRWQTRFQYHRRAVSSITPRVIAQSTRFLHLPEAIRFIQMLSEASGKEHPDLAMRNQLIAKSMLQVGLRVKEVVSIPAAWVSEIPVEDARPLQLSRVEGKGGKRRAIEWPTQLLLESQEYIDFQRQRNSQIPTISRRLRCF